jgi:hypothetical protein
MRLRPGDESPSAAAPSPATRRKRRLDIVSFFMDSPPVLIMSKKYRKVTLENVY